MGKRLGLAVPSTDECIVIDGDVVCSLRVGAVL